MTQTNSKWELSLAKGEYAESIIKKYFEARGFVIYSTEKKDKAHAFDILATKNKSDFMIVDVKAKARRTRYADTGINLSHFNEYAAVRDKYKMPVWIVFVDEASAAIYGNALSDTGLLKPAVLSGKTYPLIENTMSGKSIIYFPLANMATIAKLSDEDVLELKKMSAKTRNYSYDLNY